MIFESDRIRVTFGTNLGLAISLRLDYLLTDGIAAVILLRRIVGIAALTLRKSLTLEECH